MNYLPRMAQFVEKLGGKGLQEPIQFVYGLSMALAFVAVDIHIGRVFVVVVVERTGSGYWEWIPQ